MFKKLMQSKTIKNAGWIIGGRIVQMLINLVVGLLTARYLGPSNFGIINYAGAYTSIFMSLCTLGINSVIVKEFVDHPGQVGTIIGTTLWMRAISSFCSALAIIGIVFVVDDGDPTTILIVSLCSVGLIFNIFETFNYWFQSKLESKVTAIVTLAAYAVTSAYKVFLMVTGKGITYFALATSIDYFCIGFGMILAYRKCEGSSLHISWEYGKGLLKKSVHFILPGLMVAIYGQTDKMMLKQMIGASETGFYSTAVSVCSAWCFVLAAVIDSMYPSIMSAYKHSKEKFVSRNKLLYFIIFYLSLSVSLLFTVFAKPIIFLLYGEAYLPSVAPLRIITWYTAFSYLGVARNAWIVCENRQKYLIWVYASAAALNVVLNTLLIPSFGASGAAAASLLAQIITVLVVPFFIKGLKENSVMILEAICMHGIHIKDFFGK